MSAKPRPFSFDEFRNSAPRSDDAPRPRAYAAEDLATARAEGVVEGRRLAMESIAADEAAALQRIGAHLVADNEAVEKAITGGKASILCVARAFLEEFCTGLASAREIETAEDLLRRLTEHSEDRRTARLFISAKSHERLRGRLDAVIERRGLADFVTLDADHGLQPGEARLEWRGGEARRGRAEIAAAIAAIIDPILSGQTEQKP